MSALRITETAGEGGWREIGVRNSANDLLAVITHPCAGAKWFIHWPEWVPRTKCATKEKALAAVLARFAVEG